jgi:hypothetical protein
MTDDLNKDESINEETVKNAIDVLKSVVSKFGDNKGFIKRSGKDRRQDIMMPYIRAFGKKMLENFSSAKMMMFFLPLFMSCYFLYALFDMYDLYITFIVEHPNAADDLNKFFKVAMDGFISWCTFTVSLGGTIIVVRETFKVQKLKALNSGDPEVNDDIKDMQD